MFSKLRFSRKVNLKKCTSFEEQKGTRYIRGNAYFGIIVFNCYSSTKSCLRFHLICFARDIKGFYQSSFGDEVHFTNISNVSPNILAKNYENKLCHSKQQWRGYLLIYMMLFSHWLFRLKDFSANSSKGLLYPLSNLLPVIFFSLYTAEFTWNLIEFLEIIRFVPAILRLCILKKEFREGKKSDLFEGFICYIVSFINSLN